MSVDRPTSQVAAGFPGVGIWAGDLIVLGTGTADQQKGKKAGCRAKRVAGGEIASGSETGTASGE